MPRITVVHDVVDVDNWLQFKSERADALGMLGATNVVDHVAQDGTRTVAVAADVDDVSPIVAALSSPPPEVASVMEKHGVVPPLTIYVER